MSEFLKGNYDLNTKISESEDKESSIEEEFRKKAINSIGGSMVFVERNRMTWDGDAEEETDDN